MARAQTAATPDPTQGVAIPQNTGSTKAVAQPIGVPFYVIDPQTGQPQLDAQGQPMRWGAAGTAAPGTNTLGGQGQLVHAGGQPTYQLPRYFDGAEWLPAQLPPDELAQLQRKMVAAGLMKSGAAQLGVWDVTSMNAYKELLAYANASGMDAGTALEQWGSAHALDPNAGRAPLVKQVTSLDDLRPVIRKAFIDTLGVGISQEQVDHLAAQFQAMQGGAQEQAYNMQDSGGTVTQPPSAADFATAQAREQNPVGAQEHDVIGPNGPLQAFKQMLNGWQ